MVAGFVVDLAAKLPYRHEFDRLSALCGRPRGAATKLQ